MSTETITIFQSVKTALRISHTSLDNEINENIATARAELVRVGVTSAKAQSDDDPLIRTAIKTYCLSVMANDKESREGYDRSWNLQKENLRKTTEYNTVISTTD